MKHLLLVLLIISGAALLAPRAEAVVTYANGDLLMGFWATGGNGATQDYVIDLGQITRFEGVAPGASFSLIASSTTSNGVHVGNIGADLSGTYGSSWIQDSNLYWAAAAVDPSSSASFRELYVTDPENPAGTIANEWHSTSNSGMTAYGPITSVAGPLLTTSTTANSSAACFEVSGATQSWDTQMSTTIGSAFGYFPGNIGGAFANTGTVAGDDPLDLYQLIPGTSSTKQVNYLGTFTIDSSGDLTFTNDTAVPEPGTYGLLLWGVGAFVLVTRYGKARLRS